MFKRRAVKSSDQQISQKRKKPIKLDDISSESGNSDESDGEIIKPVIKKRNILQKRERQESSGNELDSSNIEILKKEKLWNDEPSSKEKDDEKTDDLSITKARLQDNLFKTDRLLEEEYEFHKSDSKPNTRSLQSKDSEGNNIYTGRLKQTNSTSAMKLKPNPKHIKTTMQMDFQADVCKDFLKSGYCGFGDTCKFLHYRDEFKVSNKANKKKEWEEVAKRHKKF